MKKLALKVGFLTFFFLCGKDILRIYFFLIHKKIYFIFKYL